MATLQSQMTQISRIEQLNSDDLIFFLATNDPDRIRQFLGNQNIADSTAKAYQRSIRTAINLIGNIDNNPRLRRRLERKYHLQPGMTPNDILRAVSGRRRRQPPQPPIPPNPPQNGAAFAFRVNQFEFEYNYRIDNATGLQLVKIRVLKWFQRPYSQQEVPEIVRETEEMILSDFNTGLNFDNIDFWHRLILTALIQANIPQFNPIPFNVVEVKLYCGYRIDPQGDFWRRFPFQLLQNTTTQNMLQKYMQTLTESLAGRDSEKTYLAVMGTYHFMNM